MNATNNPHGPQNQQTLSTMKKISNPNFASHSNIAQMDLKGNIKWDSMESIVNPGLNDVLCGRGSAVNTHIGNIRFRDMVKKYQGRYRSACKSDKPLVALEIVLRWKVMSPPGRFLSKPNGSGTNNKNQGDDGWYEISEEKAARKVAQRLRETDSSFAASQLRRRVKQQKEMRLQQRACQDNGNIHILMDCITQEAGHCQEQPNIQRASPMNAQDRVADLVVEEVNDHDERDDFKDAIFNNGSLYDVFEESQRINIGLEEILTNEPIDESLPTAAVLVQLFD